MGSQNVNENKGYYLQSDPEIMELFYLEYDGRRAPENIQFTYSQSNIHDLEELIDLLNKKNNQVIKSKKDIEVLDSIIAMLERRNKRQRKQLEKIYKSISNNEWDKVIALYWDSKHDYEEIVWKEWGGYKNDY